MKKEKKERKEKKEEIVKKYIDHFYSSTYLKKYFK
jgi:hypothetical protein